MRIRAMGLSNAISKLKAYQKSLDGKKRRLLEKLAEIGIDVATLKFTEAEYDGEHDVVVNKSPEWVDDNKLFITATGNSVLFIEFGTGVYYAEQHPKGAELGMIRGTYGQGKGSQNTWGYYGVPGKYAISAKDTDKGTLVLTHGNPPARAMYDAGKDMRDVILRAAREVFRGE